MMSTESYARLPIAGVIALVAAGATALLWNTVPLEVKRPEAEPLAQRHAGALQYVDARLWEDPLAAVERHRRVSENARSQSDVKPAGSSKLLAVHKLCESIFPEVNRGGQSKGTDKFARMLVLGVMMSGARYRDASEHRARSRYAVLAALSTAHFVPYDSQRLGIADYPKPADRHTRSQTSNKPAEAVTIPFEVFERRPPLDAPSTAVDRDTVVPPQMPLKILVLWIEEEPFVGAPGEEGATPIANLHALFTEVQEGCRLHFLVNARRHGTPRTDLVMDTAIIGPATSDALRAMVLEAATEQKYFKDVKDARESAKVATKPEMQNRSPVFYSATATSSAIDLLALSTPRPRQPCDGLQPNQGPWPMSDWRAGYEANPRWTGSVLYWYFRRCGIEFLSTASTDEELAHVLIDELKTRDPNGLGLASDDYRVVLVHERDTYYGRTLPKAFIRAAGMVKPCADDELERDAVALGQGSAGGPPERPCTILTYTYARGLDGQQPSVRRDTDKPSGDAKQDAMRIAELERPEGNRQFDHMRRLAARIVSDQRLLQGADESSWFSRLGATNKLRVRAVGIFGSDVYDKLAVLRALRPQFPDAVFFTTDLDARLLDVDQNEWVRNLVVASSFGLQLTPCIQRSIPPFRGVYQTSAYLATRIALHNVFPYTETGRPRRCPSYPEDLALPPHLGEPLHAAKQEARIKLTQMTIDAWLITPRLFEIGRTAPFALLDSPRRHKDAVGNVHPGSDAFVPSNAHGLAGLIGFAVIAGGLLLVPTPRRRIFQAWEFCCAGMLGERGRYGWRAILISVIVLVLVLDAMLITAYLESARGAGEPLRWVEGISVWPSQLLRTVGLMIALCCIFAVLRLSERNLEDLDGRFDLSPAPELPGNWSGYMRWRARWRSRRRGNDVPRESDQDGPGERVRRDWREHRMSSSPEACMLHAALWAGVFFLVAYALMELLGYPNLPSRGQAMARLNQFLIFTLVPSFLLLLFLVVELTGRCIQLADRVKVYDSWPVKAVERVLPRFVRYSGKKEDNETLAARVVNACMKPSLLAERSAAITPLVFYPLSILALLIVARAGLFDGWNISVGLIFVLGASFLVCCIVAWTLHWAAERVRGESLAVLKNCLIERQGGGEAPPGSDAAPDEKRPDENATHDEAVDEKARRATGAGNAKAQHDAAPEAGGPSSSVPNTQPTESQIKSLIARIEELREGAFRPAWEQPVVVAGLLPFVSAGGVQLLYVLDILSS